MPSTIVLLEGPDGGGKTTLASQLVQWGARYVHMGVPKPAAQPFDYWWKRLRADLRSLNSLVIDRLHWSEDVYGALFRGGSALTDLDRWVLEGWLLAHGTTVVRCLPRLATVMTNVVESFDIRPVYEEYVKEWRTLLRVVAYDYENPQPIPWRVSDLSFDHQGIGTPSPKVTFVGERHGGCREWPCTNPEVFRSSSGDYLRRALEVTGLTLCDYHVTNAFHLDEDGVVHQLPLPESLQRGKVVALGQAASLQLRRSGVKHRTVPHPQWWKRFNYHDLDGYASELVRGVS